MEQRTRNVNFALIENEILKGNEIKSTDSVSKHTGVYKNTPIDIWWDLIHSDNDLIEIEQRLKQVYESNLPELGAIIFTSTCLCNCQHCIYHIDYSIFNPCLSSDKWKRIIRNIYDELVIKTFIHNGRSIDDTGINVLKWMRQEFSDIQIGIIDNGISLIPYLDELYDIQPDWIDISLDGMEKEHDLQRNQIGFFKKTFNTINHLLERNIAPKINILICLTNINKDSIIDLIEFMNQKGFKNFFISPISTFKDYGPSEELRISGRDLAGFIKNLYASLYKFQDTWIEFNIFDVEYFRDVKVFYPELWRGFKREKKNLLHKMSYTDNEFYVNYYPLSLNGIRELIVNSNGNVLLPQVIRKGQISGDDIVGNLLSKSASEIIERLSKFKLKFYVNAFLSEKRCIGGK